MKGASPRRKKYETPSEREEVISIYFSSSCPVDDEENSAYGEDDRLAEFNPVRGFYSGGIEQYINKM